MTDTLTVVRAAKLLNVTPDAVRTMCREGRFAGAYRYRRKNWRIPAAAVELAKEKTAA